MNYDTSVALALTSLDGVLSQMNKAFSCLGVFSVIWGFENFWVMGPDVVGKILGGVLLPSVQSASWRLHPLSGLV